MIKLNTKNNRNSETCRECEDISKKPGMTQKKLDKEHNDCHRWTHCGIGCCGYCPYCGH